MPELITVTATKEHLSAALTPRSMRDVTANCLVARAIKAVVGRKTVSVYGETATIDGETYDVSKKGQALVTKFDDLSAEWDKEKTKKKLAALRAKLPINFRLTAQAEDSDAS